jgi:hypothetical protein
MGRFLDLRSSMNAGAPINVALTTPTLFGVVGLQTQGVASPVVVLSGSIGFQGAGNARARVNVVRGTTLTDVIIYTEEVTLALVGGNFIVPIDAEDLSAPAALQTVYTAFVSQLSTTAISRVGPETFWGIANSNT